MHLHRWLQCQLAYKRELIAISSRTRVWQTDDPEDMPSDMEWDEPDTEGQCIDDQQQGDDEGMVNGLRKSSLFKDYLAAVASKSHSSNASTAEPLDQGGDEDVNNVPHAIPAVKDYYPNQKAGQPVQMEPRASPQAQVSGHLANEACFQLADFINSVGMTSSKRDTFFKLELNQHLPWKNNRQFMADMNSLPAEPQMQAYSVSIGKEDDAQTVEFQAKNIIEVVEKLVSDPRYEHCINYVPY